MTINKMVKEMHGIALFKNGRFVKTIKCDALSDLQCEGCKFYKTKEKHEADR